MPNNVKDEKGQLNLRLPQSLIDQLRVVAEVEGEYLSPLIKGVLEDYIESKRQDPEWQEKHKEWATRQRALLKALAP